MLRLARVLAVLCIASVLANAECMAQCSVRMCSPQPEQQQPPHCHHHQGKSSNAPTCPHQQAFAKSPSYSLPGSYAAAVSLQPAVDHTVVAPDAIALLWHYVQHPPPLAPDLTSLSVLRV